MNRVNPKTLFYLLLIAWFLLNLIQGLATELTLDEAYYWLWGQFPAAGYFDHPPMVGWLAYLGDLMFSGNLGVRLLTVVLQPVVILILSLIAGVQLNSYRNVFMFWLITASMIMFNAYGFITTPDVPLLFFASLFLLAYRYFLQKESFVNILLMAVSMAGMIYSKYHGGLFIVLIILSNKRLLLNYRFYVAGILAIILLLPHIGWQYQHGFPGFSYHLSDRVTGFNWYNPLEYWLNQLLVFNPFTLIACFWVMVVRKAKDQFEKSLRYVLIGFLAFFWLMSFRGHAEPHWTVLASLPMLVLIYRESLENVRLMRYLKRFVLPSLALVLIARILLMSGLLPERLGFNGKKEKYEAFQTIAGNVPVVFSGSFQGPSLYRFFTGKEATVISAIESRKTQFDLWKFDNQYDGKRVFIPSEYKGRSKVYDMNGFQFNGFFTDSLQITNHISIRPVSIPDFITSNDTIKIIMMLKNEGSQAFLFNHSVFPVQIKPVLLPEKAERISMDVVEMEMNKQILPNQQQIAILKCVYRGDYSGKANFAVLLHSFFGHTFNSDLYPVEVSIK
jgi:4-amino-4-deoxy-L-arabinose transferase-like glycosyltransferase